MASPEQYADHLFDAVCAGLGNRPAPGPWASPPARATKEELWEFVEQAACAYRRLRLDLVAAGATFEELHEWLAQGRPLPQPWRRHTVSRPGGGGECRTGS